MSTIWVRLMQSTCGRAAVAGVAAVVLLFVGEPFSQKDLDEQAAEQTKQTTGDQNA